MFSTNQFSFNPNDRTLCAELSELVGDRRRQVFQPVYADAADLGLRVVSTATGKEVVFAIVDEDYSGEDLAGWWLEPTRESKRAVPACANLRMLIIND